MLEYSQEKEEKDAISNINNNSTIPIHTTEGPRISVDSHEDHESSEEMYSPGKRKSVKGQPNSFLFKVKKLGQKGITHKTTKQRSFRRFGYGSNQQNALRVIARTNQQKRNDIGKRYN